MSTQTARLSRRFVPIGHGGMNVVSYHELRRYEMPKKKMLMVLGGTRVGDTLHAIPFLRKACKEYSIHWVHGSYGKEAAQFIRDEVVGMDITLECKEDEGLPNGLGDSVNFATRNSGVFDAEGYDVCMPQVDMGQTAYPKLVGYGFLETDHVVVNVTFNRMIDSLVKLNHAPFTKGHVVVQPTTCSGWKNLPALQNLGTQIFQGKKVFNVGTPEDRVLQGPNLEITNGAHFSEVARLVRSAELVIAPHSSVACLAFYLGVPLICVSFGKSIDEFYPFCRGRPNNVTLLRPQQQELFRVINDYLAKPRKRMEPEDLL